MKVVIFGLTISSTWGNGHATLWRGLCRALANLGHDVVFFERDVPYYAAHRDLAAAEWCRIVLYRHWETVARQAARELADADAGIVTSYCPDGAAASATVLASPAARKIYYDLDAPVTLSRLARGETVPYLPAEGLSGFDLVLSYAGGATLPALQSELGATAVAPLYGSVDPEVHRPVPPAAEYRSHLSYLGTYAEDRQAGLEQLLLAPARRRPRLQFAIAGSQYPDDFAWPANVNYLSHLAPAQHPALFCASGATLNVTRAAMAAAGYCPSGRLFEAAACGVAIVSDWWEGLDEFFTPGDELFVAGDTEDVLTILDLPDAERQRVARRGRERALDCHTAMHRARELERLLAVGSREPAGAA